jgi:hypothetical protein
VRPITAGYRLTLIYNLLRKGGEPLPEAPDYAHHQARATALLQGWAEAAGTSDDNPDKLIYPLEHAYTQAELGFDTLKGVDAAVAAVVTSACEAADCDCHLALLTIEESGWAEYAGDGWGDEEYEIGEVTDSSENLQHWRHPDGSRPAMGALPFHEKELCPPNALADLDDTEPEFEEATGNAGASFERFYQRAALVLWPRAGRARVVADGGLDVSVPFLNELVRRWEDQAWPTHDWARKQASESGHGRTLLDSLARLGDLEQRTAFLAEQALAGAYGPADNPALADLLRQLPPEKASELLSTLIADNGRLQTDACANLLFLCTKDPSLTADCLRPAAVALIGTLPDGSDRAGRQPAFGGVSPRRPTPELIMDTLTAFEHIDPALAGNALEQFFSLPEIYPMVPSKFGFTLSSSNIPGLRSIIW